MNQWFAELFSRPGPRSPRRARLEVEGLERRLVPARAGAATYFGFAYGPYVGQWLSDNTGKHPPAFNSYGSGNASVQNQINLIGPRVSALATYSAGYAGYYPPTTPYNKVDSAWMVAGAAANYNKAQKQLALTVQQGIYQQVQSGSILNSLMNAEINGAFQIAKAANAVYPGTVKRLVFTNEYATDAASTNQVDQLIKQNRDRAHDMGLTVGVRSQTFGQLNDPRSPYLKPLQQLVKDVDFIMCNLYPVDESKGVAAGASDVENEFVRIKTAAQKLNPKLAVMIGETGWPSQGISFNDLTGKDNTVANAQAYAAALAKWAESTKTQVFYFEAIDEPWKSNQNQKGGNPWTGPNGSEGHYGIWYYSASNSSGKFIAKWSLNALHRPGAVAGRNIRVG